MSGPHTLTGVIAVGETLHLRNGGTITVASPSLTLNIAGSLIMDAGSMIDGGDRTCFGTATVAFPISIYADGDIDVQGPGAGGTPPGAIVRANACSGAAIELIAAGNANLDGTVESVGTRTGTGAVGAIDLFLTITSRQLTGFSPDGKPICGAPVTDHRSTRLEPGEDYLVPVALDSGALAVVEAAPGPTEAS